MWPGRLYRYWFFTILRLAYDDNDNDDEDDDDEDDDEDDDDADDDDDEDVKGVFHIVHACVPVELY